MRREHIWAAYQRSEYSPSALILRALRLTTRSERTPALPRGLFNWITAFWKIPDSHALRHQTLDGYLFLRFLRVCTTICFVGLCMTWPILFPLNITGGGSSKELDKLSMSNVDSSSPSGRNRLYGHVLVGWLFYGFVLYMVFRECIFYINLRQAYLLAPQHARRISPRTVLFTCVPGTYLDEQRLRAIFANSAKRIWVTRDTEKLDELVEERTKAAMRLEKAEVTLLKLCNQERIKAIKKGAAADKAPPPPPAQDGGSGNLAARWIPDKKRPSHRLGPLGLLGKKVDTIEWCRAELQRLTPLIETAQGNYRALEPKAIPAVFIEFHTQSDAQAAFQILAHHQPLHMIPKHIGIRPGEIIWKNLRLPWWQRVVRRYAVVAFIVVMIVFWAVPVAFVSSISQVSYLTAKFSWLSWINDIPKVVLGFITGLLPPVALAVLMSLVPVVMRLCGKVSGEPTVSRVELFTQNAYFAFQVVQVFLVTTIASGAATAYGQLSQLQDIGSNPTKVFDILASSLPKASNFYINFFIIQGLTIAVGVIAQVAGFVIFYLMYKFLAKTPRAMFMKWTTLSAISWGSVMPIYTNIAVISEFYFYFTLFRFLPSQLPGDGLLTLRQASRMLSLPL
jgi:calcium permeable stress-gated cation channel